MERGNPEIITEFPSQESLGYRLSFTPDNKRLADEIVSDDYIAITQKPGFKDEPRYRNEGTRDKYIFDEGLRILRPYQSKAIHALQAWAKEDKHRFLFEMATGTGKTLISAFGRDFEKKFYSEKTNTVFCRIFLEKRLERSVSTVV